MTDLQTKVRLIPAVAVLIFSALLSACEGPPGAPPVLSLEEAKQVTATFEGQAFVPPPKTIKDITAILDQQKPIDPQAAEIARAAAATEPPPDLSGQDLANFYRKRAIAAKNIGNIKQQLADMRMALQLSEGEGPEVMMRRLWDVAVAELLGGNHAESMRLREQAIAIVPYKKRGALIHYRSLMAGQYANGGDMATAKAHLDAAEQLLNEARSWKSWPRHGNGYMGQIERARASILATQGKFRKAEKLYRSAIVHLTRDAEKSNNPYSNVLIESTRGSLAWVLASQGRLVEAEVEARKALINTLSYVGRYSQDTAHMIDRLAKVLLLQGRFAEAETLARATLDIYDKIGMQNDSLQLNKARRTLARTLIYQQRWNDALNEYEGIRLNLVDNSDTFESYFAADLDWALALLRAGRPAEAEVIAAAALERAEKLKKRRFRQAKARALMAQTLAAQGKREAALKHFMTAVPVLISRAKRADDESETQAVKEGQLTMLLEFYIDLLANVRGTALEREAGIDAAAEAFRIADAARGQSVQQALSASGARASVDNPELADYARREQDTQKQISTLNTLLADVLSQPTSQKNTETIAALRTNIDQLRGAHVALIAEIESRFPDYADLIDPKPATKETARALLRPGEALISTYVGERRTYIWAVPRQGKIAFHAADLGREDLTDTVAWLRSALEPSAQTLGDIPDFDVVLAYDLFAELLVPVRAGWEDSNSLLVVAHGPLGYLPLSVLPTQAVDLKPESGALFSNHRDVPWLARSHAVTMLPSVNSLKTLRGLPPGNENRKAFAGFGDPYFASDHAAMGPSATEEATMIASRGIKTRGLPVRLRAAPQTAALDSAGLSALPRLPDTSDEIQSIALALHADLSQDIFLGERANEGLLKSTNLSGYRVLAFATHGLVPGDLDGLAQPALALTAPNLANDPNNDGLLTMGEILSLRLDADWVVLSACNTGTGRGAGAEAVSGLGRAFFYAGTRALLVSNWPVETTSAKRLTTDLFSRQAQDANLSRAEALRQAMLGLLDGDGHIDPATGKQVFAYAHPIFWAPFTLIGDGG